VASVAARHDFSVDAIDDLRIAVDEACASLLAIPSPATYLTVRITVEDGALIVVASTDATPEAWPPPGAQQTLAWQVLSALTNDIEFERDGEGAALRLMKRG
jgi:serine/threonine-protein kinase RsbW